MEEVLERVGRDLAALAEEVGVDYALTRFGFDPDLIARYGMTAAINNLNRTKKGTVVQHVAASFMHGVLVGAALSQELAREGDAA